jgi:hypothetical protein
MDETKWKCVNYTVQTEAKDIKRRDCWSAFNLRYITLESFQLEDMKKDFGAVLKCNPLNTKDTELHLFHV